MGWWIMIVIGLTGGIGSGKSTVAQLLAELGAVVIDADKLGHEVFKPGTGAWREVVAAFGEDVLGKSQEIDRRKLGKIVFRDADSLQKLNRIMHPRILELVKARLEDCRHRGVAVVVLEATLLIEAGWTSLVDRVWVTVSSKETVVERLKERGLSGTDSMARILSQMPAAERINHADVIINNESSLEELKSQVVKLWQELGLPRGPE